MIRSTMKVGATREGRPRIEIRKRGSMIEVTVDMWSTDRDLSARAGEAAFQFFKAHVGQEIAQRRRAVMYHGARGTCWDTLYMKVYASRAEVEALLEDVLSDTVPFEPRAASGGLVTVGR
jgi:hypothetical protein